MPFPLCPSCPFMVSRWNPFLLGFFGVVHSSHHLQPQTAQYLNPSVIILVHLLASLRSRLCIAASFLVLYPVPPCSIVPPLSFFRRVSVPSVGQ